MELGQMVRLGLSISLERLQLNELPINAPAFHISISPFSPLILLEGVIYVVCVHLPAIIS